MTAIVLRGDARQLPLPDGCVDLLVTSPPYFGLRSYTDGGEHYGGQIGSEATPAEWVAALVACTREWMRVLKPSGSMFVNLGDKYAGVNPASYRRHTQPVDGGMGYHAAAAASERAANHRPAFGAARDKSLLGLPWRYALACTDQLGLILRRDIIWAKPNGLPESVTDRCRSSHEYLFHLVRQPRYYAAVDEIREPHTADPAMHRPGRNAMQARNVNLPRTGTGAWNEPNPLGKLPGSVWNIPSQPLTVPPHLGVDHFAAFPMELPRRCVLGWSPPGACVECGEGRRPVRGVDWSTVPHVMTEKRALTAEETAGWCADFADWCDLAGITRNDLDTAAGTSDMGGWWASRLPHRAAIPTPEQWNRLRVKFDPPSRFDELVHLTRLVPTAGNFGGDPDPNTGILRRHRTGSGMTSTQAPARTITGYACACPTPDAPTRPSLVVDPFGGTGTTALVASMHGRIGVSIDRSADYTRLARWRTTDPGERAKALQVPKPPPVTDGQDSLFAL